MSSRSKPSQYSQRISKLQAQLMLRPLRNAIVQLRDTEYADQLEQAAQAAWSYADAFEALFQNVHPALVKQVMASVTLRDEMDQLGLTNTRLLVGADRIARYLERLQERRAETKDELTQNHFSLRIGEARRFLRFLEVLGDVELESEVLDVDG